MIEEEVEFNEAVQAVIAWVESNGGWKSNLLVVTGDHESGYLTGPLENDNSGLTNPIVNKGKGLVPGMKFNSTGHSNQLIPFFAKGTGSSLFSDYALKVDPVRGKYIDNTQVAGVFFQLWPLR